MTSASSLARLYEVVLSLFAPSLNSGSHAARARAFLTGLLLSLTAAPGWGANSGPHPTGPNIQPAAPANSGYYTTLYGYGTAAGDVALPRSDDGFQLDSLVGKGPGGSSLVLPFYSTSYDSLYVNNNGAISFGAGVSAFTPQAFPTSVGVPMLAPFWADVDTRPADGGYVWYRTEQDAATLADISATIRSSFLGTIDFNATYAEIVTWDRVGSYSMHTDFVNTFQAVVASDGVQTYTMFLYPYQSIWWAVGDASGGVYPQVGFDAGDRVHFYNATGSRTNSVYDLWFLTNTTPANPGTQVYRIDGLVNIADPNGNTTLSAPPLVVAGDLSLPATRGTAADVLRLGANPAGHTISSSAAAGSLQFNKLVLDDPSDAVTFAGAGVYIANAENAITNGNITLTDNALLIARNLAKASPGDLGNVITGGAITLRKDAQIQIYSPNATSGGAALTFDNTAGGTGGTLDLRGYDTAFGTVNSTGGAGLVTNSGATPATFTFGSSVSGTFDGVIRDGAAAISLVKTGSGTQILTNANTYTGGTTINAGTLQLGSGGATGSIVGPIVNNASLVVNRSNTFTLASIAGIGSLTKLGAGTLVLSGANTYTGDTNLTAGTLLLGNSLALQNSVLNYRTVDSGTLATGALAAISLGGLSGDKNLSLGSGVALTVGGIDKSSTYTGQFTSGAFTKVGSGIFTLGGVNNPASATVSAGGLVFANPSALFTPSSTNWDGKLVVNSGAMAGFRVGGEGEFTAAQFAAIAPATSGTGGFQSGSFIGMDTSLAGGFTYAGVIANRAGTVIGFEKFGAGSITLTGANTYTGGTRISGGTLTFGNGSALPATGSILFTGGALQYAPGNTTDYSSRFSTAAGQRYSIDTNGQNGTLATALTSVGGTFTKSGAGTLTLTGANTFTGVTTIDAGTLQIGNGGATGSLGITTVVNNGTLAFNRSDSVIFSGDISGSGSVTKLGSNALDLRGANTYTGLTTISGGSLTLRGNSTLTGDIVNNGSLVSSAANILRGNISGTGSLTVQSGTLTLTGANTYTGATTISGGTLQLGDGITGGSIAGNVTTTNTISIFRLNLPGTSTFSGNISGSGSLYLASENLTLTGTNTYTGGTYFTSGAATFATPSAVPATGVFVFSGGTLRYSAGNTTDYSGRFGNFISSQQKYSVDTNGLDITFASSLTNPNSSFMKLGDGTLTLSGANNFGGAITLGGGTLRIGSVNALGGAGTFAFTGGTLQYSAALSNPDYSSRFTTTANQSFRFDVETGGTASLNTSFGGTGSSLTKLGGGTLTLGAANTFSGQTRVLGGTLVLANGLALQNSELVYSSADSGTLTINAASAYAFGGLTSDRTFNFGSSSLTIGGGDTNSTLAGSFTAGAFTKVGSGTFTLTGTNTFTSLTLAGGSLLLGSATAIPSTGTITFTGGALKFSAANTTDYSSRFSTVAPAQYFAFDTNGQNVTLAGNIGAVSGNASNLAKFGDGTLTLTGSNTFNAGIILNGGTLALGRNTALGSTGKITFNGGALQYTAANTLDYSSRFDTSVNQAVRIDTNGLNGTLASALTSPGGTLTKIGAGTLTLGGANTYTGDTTILGGTLALANSLALQNSTLVYASTGGTLTTSQGAITLGSLSGNKNLGLGTTALTVGGNGAYSTFSGALTTGAFTKAGAGTFTLTGANSFASITLSAGALSAGSSGALGSAGAITFNGGTLQYAPGIATDYSARITAAAGKEIRIDTNGNDVTFASASNASGASFTKLGNGTLTLTGANSYSAGVMVSVGTLQVGNGGATGAIDGNIVDNTALVFNRSSDSTYAGAITGTGSVAKSGAGALVLTGANAYTGGTIVNAGTLRAGGASTLRGGATGADYTINGGTLDLAGYPLTMSSLSGTGGAVTLGGATLTVNQADAASYAGAITGTGGFTKLGAGALTLSGISVFSRALSPNEGTLTITGSVTSSTTSGLATTGGTATLNIMGAGANWTSQADTLFGQNGGTGNLVISAGGTASDTFALVGRTAGGTGNVTVTGAGSTWTHSAGIVIGTGGTGTMLVSDGGVVTNADGTIAGDAGSSGAVTVTGANSRWTSNSYLVVGSSGAGVLTVASSGTVKVGSTGAGTLTLANSGAGAGTLNIGAAAGQAAVAPGTVQAASVTGGSGSGAKLVNFNHTGAAYAFAPVLSGSLGVQQNAGTTILAGTNTYTGATTINGGKLVVNGSLSASSSVMVNSGAALGGSGSVGAVTLGSGGKISPGNSPGVLNTGAETWAGGAGYVWELNNASDAPGAKGVSYDWLNITGTLNIAATSGSKFTIHVTSLTAGNAAGATPGFNHGQSYQWILASASGGITNFSADKFAINTSDFQAPFGTLNPFAISQIGNDLILSYTAVPEPSIWGAGLGFALLGLILLRRQRPSRT